MQYWLKVGGTGKTPIDTEWLNQWERWREMYGEVTMFPRRVRVAEGDLMILYAAGSPARFGQGRIYGVEAVIGPLQQVQHERWSWALPTALDIAGPSLDRCPTLEDIGVDARSVRRHSHIRLTQDQGERAENLLKAADRRYRSGA
jgi:hypothetical protein